MKNSDLLTKKETIRFYTEGFLGSLGVYKRFRTIQPKGVGRVVFVCKGNICRSALAEWYMKKNNITAASFGLDCPDGDPANDTMIAVAQELGIALDQHQTTSFASFSLQKGDLFVAMEPGQIAEIKSRIDKLADHQYALLGLFDTQQRPTIIDPYGKEKRFFEQTASLIYRAAENLRTRLNLEG